MNRILLLILIGAITFLVLLFAANPNLLNEVWLYIIGLSGAAVQLFKSLKEKLMSYSKDVQANMNQQDSNKKAVG